MVAMAAMLVTMIPLTVFAGSAWDGTTTDKSWYNESQTVFELSDAEELAGLATLVNEGKTFAGKTIILVDDIDLNNKEWTPIGTKDNHFKGSFDGANNTINNLYIDGNMDYYDTNKEHYIGLFGYVNTGGYIKNLNINNVDVSGCLYVGSVVGRVYIGGVIENCNVSGKINIDGYWYVGGIAGRYEYADGIRNSSVIGNGDGNYVKADCVNNSDKDGSYVGGIVGFVAEDNTDITNCIVKNVDVSGYTRVGGVSGIAHYGNTIKACTVDNVKITALCDGTTMVGIIAGANQGGQNDGANKTPSYVYNNNVGTDTSANVNGTPVSNLSGNTINDTEPAASLVGSDVTFDPTTGDITGGVLESYVDGTISYDADLATVTNPDGTKTTAVGTDTIKDIIENAPSGTKVLIENAEEGTDFGTVGSGVTVENGTDVNIKVDSEELTKGETATGAVEQEQKPATSDKVVDTGDNSVAPFAVAGLVLAAIAAAAVARRRYN